MHITKRLIAFAGVAGSGKSYAASLLKAKAPRDTEIIAFADPLKDVCLFVLDYNYDSVYGPSAARNVVATRYLDPAEWTAAHARLEDQWPWLQHKVPLGYHHIETWLLALEDEAMCTGGLSVRRATQTLGTEVGRALSPSLWADFAMRRASLCAAGTVVLPDLRFITEAQAVCNAGGSVYLMRRTAAGLVGVTAKHASETELSSTVMATFFTGVIENDNGRTALEAALAAHGL